MVTVPSPAVGAEPSLFGFLVRSETPLRFLREGGGVQPLEIAVDRQGNASPRGELVGEWPLHGTAEPQSAALFAVGGGYEYWTTDAGRFHVDLEGGRIELPVMDDEILREQRLNGMPMLLSFAHRGDFSLHAAAVEIDGGAVVLAAPSRFGKTTLAFAFHERGFRLLNEDLVCYRPSTQEILPGPALARLRPDVYAAAPPTGLEVVAERADRVFLAPAAGRRGSSAPLPIRGVYFLREGAQLGFGLASAVDAVKDLWHLGFRMPTAEGRAESFRQLTELAGSIPMWNVSRPFRLDLLGETVDRIVERSTGVT